jgi:hypothetical protein
MFGKEKNSGKDSAQQMGDGPFRHGLSVFTGTRGPATELDLAKLLIKLGAQISHLHPTRSYPNLLESIFVNRFLYYHDQRIKGYII